MAIQTTLTKIKANIFLNNVKKLQDSITKTKDYLPVLQENLIKANENKVNNLINKQRAKVNKINLAINPREEFARLKQVESKKLENRLYWKLREKENSHHLEKITQQQYEDELKEIFTKYDSDIAGLDSKFDEQAFENWYFKKFKVSTLDLDIQKHIKYYQEVLDKTLVENEQEVATLKVNLEEKMNKRLDLETKKLEAKLVKLELKLEKALELLEKDRELQFNQLQESLQTAPLDADENSKSQQELKDVIALYDESNETHLLIQNLSMHFGGLKAVEKLSLSVKRGEIFGLIGPNGAGKTTVFNCITQFYNPTSGDIYFKNKENYVLSLNNFQVHDVIKYGIVRTFQNVELIWELSVLDNLLVGAHTAYKSNFFAQALHLPSLRKEEEINRAKALDILEKLDLLMYKDAYPIGLPYGILKRIELARTLMLDPELIILDEPAAGLNEQESLELASLILEIKEKFNLTIFLVEHDMSFVMGICDRICVLNFGRRIALGTPKEIQNDPLVQEAYLGSDSHE
ncbi:MAG: ABC transporter ATP-binding protein [Acholeplasmataceae bacterium]|jgi:branched-chain amino acid transport system ATP-binding protein